MALYWRWTIQPYMNSTKKEERKTATSCAITIIHVSRWRSEHKYSYICVYRSGTRVWQKDCEREREPQLCSHFLRVCFSHFLWLTWHWLDWCLSLSAAPPIILMQSITTSLSRACIFLQLWDSLHIEIPEDQLTVQAVCCTGHIIAAILSEASFSFYLLTRAAY